MTVGYLIASSGDYRFPTEDLIAAVQRDYPGCEVEWASEELAPDLVVSVFIPGPEGVSRPMEVDFLRGEGGVGIEGARTPEQVAEFVTWLARTAPVPDDGSVVLIEWAPDFVRLRPDITASELLAVGPGSA